MNNPYKNIIGEFLNLEDSISDKSFSTFLLTYGNFYNPAPLPPEIKPGEKRECYMNAALLAIEYPDRFMYCEGYAVSAVVPMAIGHAWVLDIENNNAVVDNTWDDGMAYFGVAITIDALLERLVEQGVYGYFYRPLSWLDQDEKMLTFAI